MSRVRNTLINAKVSVLFHILFIFTQFFARKIFLDNLGDEFIGLTSTLQSILSFLNLAELGIGTAVGYTMYRPIFNKDYKELNDLITYFGYLYKRIGLIIIGLSIILGFFFPIIFDELTINLGIVYYAFFVLLTNALLGYFFNYHLFLLQADQKAYIVEKYAQSFTITKILLQCLFVFYFQSFFIWITLELISSILYSYILRKKIAKEYPWLVISNKIRNKGFKKFPLLLQKIKQISVHKLGAFVSSSTDNILIFKYISIESVAFYGNYMLIVNNLTALIMKLFSGTNASVGNLVAENDPKKIKKVFWEFMAMRFFIACFSTIAILKLLDPFISLWLGPKYILEHSTLVFFSINFFILQIRQPVDVFIQAYGLYDDTWAPIAQSIINLVLSIILINVYGITGVLMGTTISLILIILIWKPYFIYLKGFKKGIREYLLGFFKLSLSAILTLVSVNFLSDQFYNIVIENWLHWMLTGLKIITLTIIISFGIMYTLNKGFRDVVKRMLNLVRK
ncbi:hypothetical protein C21_02225 [Arenibacter sp. NBRC 103722]|uniref:lipopolysaccharide biosynthesis protein n=1 Tax=Arenibacter sp. NBRC 103722 TaxID=1113929 RepID=UPI00085366D8|nr:hypothetical protein [Arenibacter sp. NBRC 103722]GBF20054.1 hypothetical protein C21_02225 [Arenibacter sp. NBRC 103722]